MQNKTQNDELILMRDEDGESFSDPVPKDRKRRGRPPKDGGDKEKKPPKDSGDKEDREEKPPKDGENLPPTPPPGERRGERFGDINVYDPYSISDRTGMSRAAFLTEVQNAIMAILAGAQYYKIGSMELRRANLSDLYAIKRELEAALKAEEYRGIGRRAAAAFFDRR